MGFYAASAEDVYNYVFRTDDKDRALTDGFGWSIMLVGDDSPVCAEFLQEYCVDLCHRTANRVRFVFFSGISEKEFEAIQRREAPSERILSGVLDRLRTGFLPPGPRFDHERRGWRTIRPEALRPLRHRDDIESHLGFERQARTVIPGTEAALHFAQRLGIGRHVPCLVMFTDIGELKVDLFPFGGHSAANVYTRVRNWVDEYYEVNRDALEQWDGVENQVLQLAVASRQSLRTVQDLAPEQRASRRCLRRLAVLAHELSGSGPVDLSQAASDRDVPRPLRDTLRTMSRRLAESDAQLETCRTLNRAVQEVRSTSDPGEIERLLAEIPERGIPRNVSSLLRHERRRLAGPQEDLFDWWRNAPIRTTKTRFRSWRKGWHRLAAVDNEKSRLPMRLDHESLWASISRLPLARPTEEALDRIVSDLAAHYGLPGASASWRTAAARFRNSLGDAIDETVRTAPAWLRESALDVTIGRCIPAPGHNDTDSLLTFLHGAPELEAMVRHARDDRERMQKTALAVRDSVVAALERDSLALSMAAADKEAARAALAEVVEQQRAELERRADAGLGPPSPVCDPSLIARLRDALDAYDAAVDRIVYPHLNDPAVFSVRTSTDLRKAADLPPKRASRPRPEPLLSALNQAVADDHEALRHWPAERRASEALRPSGVLKSALADVLGSDRLARLLQGRPGRPVGDELDHLVQDGAIERLLTTLTIPELSALLTRTLPEGRDLPPERSRDALYGLILASLGLRSLDGVPAPNGAETARALKAKLLDGAFDVFLAHNSADRPAVRALCRELRRRGVQPWLDVNEIRPGTSVQDKIQLAVGKARTAIICLGPDGIGRWQEAEIRALMEKQVQRTMPLIPVMLPNARSIPVQFGFLNQFGAVAFDQDVTEEEPLAKLVWGITGDRPATTSPSP